MLCGLLLLSLFLALALALALVVACDLRGRAKTMACGDFISSPRSSFYLNLPLTPLPALPSFSPMHALDYCRLHVPSLLASTRLHMPCRCQCLPTTTFDLITCTPTPTPTSRHCLCLCLCDGAYAPVCWCLWHGLVII